MDSFEDEDSQKQAYINEHIISKGYNPEDLEGFITRKRGVQIKDLPFNILKKSIEQFKNEELGNTLSKTEKTKEEKEKEKEKAQEIQAEAKKQKDKEFQNSQQLLYDIIYSPVTYELECKKPEENPLFLLENQKIRIKIKVSDPQETSGTLGIPESIVSGFGILKKLNKIKPNVTTYLISCKEINSSVRRSFQDVEWLQNKLIVNYPFRLVPPLYKSKIFEIKEKEDKIKETERYLNLFFDEVVKKKILRTSIILYNFLTLTDDKFTQYKEEKEKYELKSDFSNLINKEGKFAFGLNQKKAVYVNALGRLLEPNIDLYDKLNKAFNNLIIDYNSLMEDSKYISDLFTAINKYGTKIKLSEGMKLYNTLFSTNFNKVSENIKKIKNVLDHDIKENYYYIGMEYSNLSNLCKNFENCRQNYESFAMKLKKIKENLYDTMNISKWELSTEDAIRVEELKQDRQNAMDAMLPKETKECEDLKKKMVLILNYISKEHESLMKHQDIRIGELWKELQKKNQSMFKMDLNIFESFDVKI